MPLFLDASGLQQYHESTVQKIRNRFSIIDSSIDELNDHIDIIDSSINVLKLKDVELGNAVETEANERSSTCIDLQNQINNIVGNSLLLSLDVSPTSIFVDDSSTINLSVNSMNSATSLIIKYDVDDTTVASGSGNTLIGSKSVTPDSEGKLGFTATAVINEATISVTSYVNCVRQIYYGSGSSYTDASTVAPIRNTPNGTYIVNVSNDGEYIFIVVPASMTVAKASINGLNVPMTSSSVTKNGVSYTAYSSVNTYDYGTYTLEIG